MSPGGSLTLSKLQSANEKRGAFWVTPSSISFSLSGETPICAVSLVETGMKIDGAAPVCHVPGQALPPTQSLWAPQQP